MKLLLMAFDGATVIEHDAFHDSFDTVEDAWRHYDDLGSKWYFYPFPFVVTESAKTIKDTPELFEVFIGMRVKTIRELFKRVSEMDEAQAMGVDGFMFFVLENAVYKI